MTTNGCKLESRISEETTDSLNQRMKSCLESGTDLQVKSTAALDADVALPVSVQNCGNNI
jgi:hypothetical protein